MTTLRDTCNACHSRGLDGGVAPGAVGLDETGTMAWGRAWTTTAKKKKKTTTTTTWGAATLSVRDMLLSVQVGRASGRVFTWLSQATRRRGRRIRTLMGFSSYAQINNDHNRGGADKDDVSGGADKDNNGGGADGPSITCSWTSSSLVLTTSSFLQSLPHRSLSLLVGPISSSGLIIRGCSSRCIEIDSIRARQQQGRGL